ncbi:hypothetical protein P4S72_06235 [Vibrio sp. PP-XX7]
MSQLIQQKIAQLDQALIDFTMQSEARVLHLHATDNDFKLAYHVLSMRAQYKMESVDVIILADSPVMDEEQYADQAVIALCQAYDRLDASAPD